MCRVLNWRVNNKATDLFAFRVEANLHSIQSVSKPEHSSNVTVSVLWHVTSCSLVEYKWSTEHPIDQTERRRI
jgi:hypothetical protein